MNTKLKTELSKALEEIAGAVRRAESDEALLGLLDQTKAVAEEAQGRLRSSPPALAGVVASMDSAARRLATIGDRKR